MRLVTPDGDLANVSLRGWPMAGLDYPRTFNQGIAAIPLTATANGGTRNATYVRLYKENPWVNAAVRTIAWGVSRTYLHVYRLEEDGQRSVVRFDRPNRGPDGAGIRIDRKINGYADRTGPQRRMRRTMTDYLIFGNALWDTTDAVAAYAPWRRVTVHEGKTVEILFYELGGTTESRTLLPEDVIHFNAGDDPESPIGVSPMEALKHTLALHEALQRHLVHFFQNAARPSANLKLAPQANKDAMAYIREQMRELYSSPENAGKVIVTTGDFQPMTHGFDQEQIIELAKQSREEISTVFRIPAPVLGVLDHAIKSNVKELREQYYRDVVGAWAPAVEDDIMAQLVRPDPTAGRFFTEFDLDAHLRPDPEAQAKAFKDLETTMSTNERRRRLNLPDLPYPEANTVSATPGAKYLGIAEPEPQPTAADGTTDETSAD
jgi:HK97 family phage portal protein